MRPPVGGLSGRAPLAPLATTRHHGTAVSVSVTRMMRVVHMMPMVRMGAARGELPGIHESVRTTLHALVSTSSHQPHEIFLPEDDHKALGCGALC
jgi:hypothetical protein